MVPVCDVITKRLVLWCRRRNLIWWQAVFYNFVIWHNSLHQRRVTPFTTPTFTAKHSEECVHETCGSMRSLTSTDSHLLHFLRAAAGCRPLWLSLMLLLRRMSPNGFNWLLGSEEAVSSVLTACWVWSPAGVWAHRWGGRREDPQELCLPLHGSRALQTSRLLQGRSAAAMILMVAPWSYQIPVVQNYFTLGRKEDLNSSKNTNFWKRCSPKINYQPFTLTISISGTPASSHAKMRCSSPRMMVCFIHSIIWFTAMEASEAQTPTQLGDLIRTEKFKSFTVSVNEALRLCLQD